MTDDQTAVIDEVVADKGYHGNQVLVDLAALDVRTYIAEPDRGRRNWKHKAAARDAVYANRRRIRDRRGLALLPRRSERLERPNAHLYETGGMRRTHLRGHTNILKRLLVHAVGFNLGLLMRTLVGITPRSLQGRLAAVVALAIALWTHIVGFWRDHGRHPPIEWSPFTPIHHFEVFPVGAVKVSLTTIGCPRSPDRRAVQPGACRSRAPLGAPIAGALPRVQPNFSATDRIAAH